MIRKFEELRGRMSPERRERNRQRTEQMVKEIPLEDLRLARKATEQMMKEIPLEELRNARKLTQVQLAESMGLSQGAVSKLERRTDMYVSTLSHFIEAMGGRLEIQAVFPEGAVKISSFSETEKDAKDDEIASLENVDTDSNDRQPRPTSPVVGAR